MLDSRSGEGTTRAKRMASGTGLDHMKVSVITIFLNAGRFLQEAIESVESQSCLSWELLLVDDGSTDEGTEIARRFADRHPGRIRYLEHEGHCNRGMSASRNLGIAHARGDYVTFLDADDVLLPTALEKASDLLDARPEIGAAFASTLYWYSWTGEPSDSGRDALDFSPGRGVPAGTLARPPEMLLRFLDDPGAVPCMCSFLVRGDLIRSVGGFEESFRGLYEDQVYYAKVALEASVLVSGDCWSWYRQHPSSCCSEGARTGQVELARSQYLEWLSRYLDSRGSRDLDLWEALDRERRLNQAAPTQPMRSRGRLHEDISRLFGIRLRRQVGSAFSRLGRRAGGRDLSPSITDYYLARFLERHAEDLRGDVLWIGDGPEALGLRVNPSARIFTTRSIHGQGTGAFDCLVATHTLALDFDLFEATGILHRLLKPGGILLATAPGLGGPPARSDPRYWGLTARSLYRLIGSIFPPRDLRIETFGNVVSAVALIEGHLSGSLSRDQLDLSDDAREVLIAARAVKAPTPPAPVAVEGETS